MMKAPSGFIAVLVVVTLALGGAVVMLKKQNPSSPQTSQSAQDALILSAAYTLELRDIIAEYRQTASPAAAKIAETKLLGITVPTERRDIHLDLILALHRLSLTKPGDAKALQSAQEKVDQVLTGTQGWLE